MNKIDRLLQIINIESGGNIKLFSESLDLKRPDRLYNVINGKNGLSEKLAILINSKYPKYSLSWMLTGVEVDKKFLNVRKELVEDFTELITKLNTAIKELHKQGTSVEVLEKLQRTIEMKLKAQEDFERLFK